MEKDENRTITLETGEYFKLEEKNPDSKFCGLNIFVRNNGIEKVKVVSDEKSILIYIE